MSLSLISFSPHLSAESFSQLTRIHLGDSDRCQDKAAGHSREIQHTCYCATPFLIFVSLSTMIKVSVSAGSSKGRSTRKLEKREFNVNFFKSQFQCALSWRRPAHLNGRHFPDPTHDLQAAAVVLLDRAGSEAESKPIL